MDDGICRRNLGDRDKVGKHRVKCGLRPQSAPNGRTLGRERARGAGGGIKGHRLGMKLSCRHLSCRAGVESSCNNCAVSHSLPGEPKRKKERKKAG